MYGVGKSRLDARRIAERSSRRSRSVKEVIVDPLDESERDVKDIRSMDVTVQEI